MWTSPLLPDPSIVKEEPDISYFPMNFPDLKITLQLNKFFKPSQLRKKKIKPPMSAGVIWFMDSQFPALVFPPTFLFTVLEGSVTHRHDHPTPTGGHHAVISLRMVEGFDNCVKQPLSHSSAIRTSPLLQMPQRWWNLSARTSHLSWDYQNESPTAQAQRHSAAGRRLREQGKVSRSWGVECRGIS